MIYRVKPEPSPGNPARNRMGDKTGPFDVNVYAREIGSERFIETHASQIPYEQARQVAYDLEQQLNSPPEAKTDGDDEKAT